jgi:oligopeptide/dipeptide ABC transporter ATP-binding protein
LFNTVKPARHQQKLKELLDAVGLSYSAAGKYPHQFSGGERQRIGIARALSTEPEFIVCDEPVSSLDVSIRAQILNLLKDLQQERNLSYLFISHDLNVVGFLSDIIAVMYKGKIVEQAESDVLYNNPLHPYTKRLLSANLKAEPQQRHKKIRVNFEEEQAQEPEKGCIFYPLCRDEKKDAQCKEVMPSLREIEPGHFVACCKIKK